MSFTGNENHSITLIDASALTANYRNSHPGEVKGHYYSKQAISAILNQPDCVGIRIYYAQDVDGNPKLVIAGVLANENDLDQGSLAEYGFPCPPHHGIANSLNS